MKEFLMYIEHIGAPGAYCLGVVTASLIFLVFAVALWWFGEEPVYKRFNYNPEEWEIDRHPGLIKATPEILNVKKFPEDNR